jgi:hypothetical protein
LALLGSELVSPLVGLGGRSDGEDGTVVRLIEILDELSVADQIGFPRHGEDLVERGVLLPVQVKTSHRTGLLEFGLGDDPFLARILIGEKLAYAVLAGLFLRGRWAVKLRKRQCSVGSRVRFCGFDGDQRRCREQAALSNEASGGETFILRVRMISSGSIMATAALRREAKSLSVSHSSCTNITPNLSLLLLKTILSAYIPM